MSVIFHKEECSACPRCGDDNVVRLIINDPSYGDANGLDLTVALDISEDGQFEMDACPDCGFKWVANDGTASTSQVKSMLLSHFISSVSDADDADLEEMIDELLACGGIPEIKKKDFIMSPRGGNEDVKLELLKALAVYVEGCDTDTLVEMYNTVYADDVMEVAESNTTDIFVNKFEEGSRLEADELIVDD